MVGQVVRRSTPFQGLRRFDPAVDLAPMTDLIRLAFAEELDAADIGVLQEMRALQVLAPVLWLFDRLSHEFQDAFGGFVWIEDGQVVGNVTVTRSAQDARLWLVSNVAVHPAYRRRGIARELMIAALDHARRRDARAVHLQVRHENAAAQALYKKLGFGLLDANTDLRADRIGPIDLPAAAGFNLQPWDAEGGRRAFALARAVVPEAWQRLQPLQAAAYASSGSLGRFAEWLRGRHVRRWAIVEGDAYAASLVADAAWRGGSHRLQLTVRPDWRGRVEDYLVAFGLRAVRELGDQRVESSVPADHNAAVDALKRHGFTVLRTLDRLGLEMVPRVRVPVYPVRYD